MFTIAISIGGYPCHAPAGYIFGSLPQPFYNKPIDPKQACQRSPLGGHVGYGQPLFDRQQRDAIADKFDRVIQDLVVIEISAEGDNNILAGNAGLEFAIEFYLGDGRDLPPGAAGSPYGRGVGTNYRSAQACQSAVHIGMAVGGYHQGARPGVALLAHDLMPDPASGGIKIDILLFGEDLNRGIFFEIGLIPILNIMVQGKYSLAWIVNFLRPYPLEFGNNGACVIVSHNIGGLYGDIIAAMDYLSVIKTNSIFLGNFLNQVLSGHITIFLLEQVYFLQYYILDINLIKGHSILKQCRYIPGPYKVLWNIESIR
jgi:hypothetical protein